MRRSRGPQLYLRGPRRKGGQRRWVILDPDARPREISTGAFGDDRATAEKKLADYLAKKHKPNFGGGHPAEVLIADALAFYAEHMEQRDAGGDNLPSSLVQLGEYFHGWSVAQITPLACEQYVPWRLAKGNALTKAPRPIKPATARNDLVVLDAALRFCVKNQQLAYSPPIPKPDPSEPRVRFLTRSEAARLPAAALGWDQYGYRHRRRINWRLARLILIGLHTGTRRGRITRLQWVENLEGGWFDLERGVLHRKARSERDTNKRAPSVPISDRLLAHIHRWHRFGGRYVIERNGRPIKGIFNAFARICRDAGLNYDGQPEAERVIPHTLRHTCVSWLLAEGRTPFQVGKYVGMSAAMVEQVYGHVTDEQQRATTNALGNRNIVRMSHKMPTKPRARA
jgi:integrase